MKKALCFITASLITASAFAVSLHGNAKNAYQRQQYILQDDAISFAIATTKGGGSVKLYDLPEGNIIVHGCVIDVLGTISTNYVPVGETVVFGVGTAADANGTLSATETNLGYASIAFTSAVTRAQAALAADVRIDGTTTAGDIYLNVSVPTNAVTTNVVGTVVGQVHLLWSQVGDY